MLFRSAFPDRARPWRAATVFIMLGLPAFAAHADLSQVRINEIMAGYNGNSNVQFVELLVADEASKAWGPAADGEPGRAQLEFYNARNELTGRFVFPQDAPAGGRTVLVATDHYAAMKSAIAPDFRMAREITPISGKVCFAGNADAGADPHVRSCVGYGRLGVGPDEDPPGESGELPILGAKSWRRISGFDFNAPSSGDTSPFSLGEGFALGIPTPAGTAIASTDDIITNRVSAGGLRFVERSMVKQGEQLFLNERFEGNGRTCSTCHIPPFFNMTPEHVAAKKPWDPLFLAERNRGMNNVVLSTPSAPSDLRGLIKDARGNSGYVVKGTGDRYIVTNGLRLTGVVTDGRGNSGTIASVSAGDLRGPNPINGSSNGIEDPTGGKLRRSNDPAFPLGRALVLENIDGFDQLEVFRKSPHLLNLKHTAPYGLSGNFATLAEFTTGAVKQHFPLSLQRRDGIDFRLPTQKELDALVAFQESLESRPKGNPRLAADFAPELYNVTTLRQWEGVSEFFVLCSSCHTGSPLFAHHRGISSNATLALATGVANSPINANDALPSEPPGAATGASTRAIDTPSLFGIRHTAPYFHDASAATLDAAVEFYNSPAFKNAAAQLPETQRPGPFLADPNFTISPGAKNSIVAFLKTLTRLPIEFPRGLSFGTTTLNSVTVETISITNTGQTPLTITSAIKDLFPRVTAPQGALDRFDRRGLPEVMVDFGPPASSMDAAQFDVPSDLVGRVIEPGQTLDIETRFAPTVATPVGAPFWSAMLNVGLKDAANETWDIGIQLIGKAQ